MNNCDDIDREQAMFLQFSNTNLGCFPYIPKTFLVMYNCIGPCRSWLSSRNIQTMDLRKIQKTLLDKFNQCGLLTFAEIILHMSCNYVLHGKILTNHLYTLALRNPLQWDDLSGVRDAGACSEVVIKCLHAEWYAILKRSTEKTPLQLYIPKKWDMEIEEVPTPLYQSTPRPYTHQRNTHISARSPQVAGCLLWRRRKRTTTPTHNVTLYDNMKSGQHSIIKPMEHMVEFEAEDEIDSGF